MSASAHMNKVRVAAMRSRMRVWRCVVGHRAMEALHLPSVYTQLYDRLGCIFVHVPKCAGTSIATMLYGRDPWHYSVNDLLFINPTKFARHYSFATVRDPWHRLYSIYQYAPVDVKTFWLSPYKHIAHINSFEQFVDALDAGTVMQFPFLRPQTSFL